MAKYIFLILLGASFVACKKVNLDSLAFPYESLDQYAFDSYDDPEIIIDDSLKATMSLVNLISMKSFSSETGEEYTIYGVYIGDTNSIATDSIIVYLHGQSRHMDYYWTRSALLANTGYKYQYGVFVFDYRGYGMSEGKPSETGLYEDADAAIDWLISKGAQGSRTFYYGYSLGAIPAIDRAAYREDFTPAKLIIESPLASVQYLTQSSTVITVDSKFVSTLEFDNAEKIKDIQIPLMWLHGVEDTYVNISNGELIFENAASPYKEAHRIEGSGHSEVPVLMGYDNYLQVLENFILKN